MFGVQYSVGDKTLDILNIILPSIQRTVILLSTIQTYSDMMFCNLALIDTMVGDDDLEATHQQ